MKKIHLLVLSFFTVITIFSCISTYAGSRPGALSLTLGAGEEFFASKRQMKNPGIVFGAVGYDFTQNWGVEGLFGSLHTHFKSELHDRRRISGTLLALDGVYHYPLTTLFEPYVMAGVGITTLNPNRNEAVDEGNVNAGAGLQFFIHKQIALRLEARDFYVINGGKNDVMVDGAVSVMFDFC